MLSTRKLISWISEPFFQPCFECMCVLTIWMLRRFNLLCQVKFTSFRLRLAFLEDFIKIGISSELNSDSLSLSVFSLTQGVTCYMCRVNIMGWWQVRTFSGVTLYCLCIVRFIGQYSPECPLHLVTMAHVTPGLCHWSCNHHHQELPAQLPVRVVKLFVKSTPSPSALCF